MDEEPKVISKSSIKLMKTLKSANWEIKIVEGFLQREIDAMREEAVRQHKLLLDELGVSE